MSTSFKVLLTKLIYTFSGDMPTCLVIKLTKKTDQLSFGRHTNKLKSLLSTSFAARMSADVLSMSSKYEILID